MRRARQSYAKTFGSPEERLHRMLVEAKSRALSRGIEFGIVVDDVEWNDVCPVLGIEIIYQRNKGHGGDNNSPSIDRVDNKKGYVKGNVRLISNRANKIKNNMTREEAILLVQNWEKISVPRLEKSE
jgi:hypothetical protein